MVDREKFEAWIMQSSRRSGTHINKDSAGKYLDNRVAAKWSAWQAALAAQAQQTELVAWGYAWQCKSVGDWRIEKLGEGCIPPKDTLALYVLPPAPEGDKPCKQK